MKALRDDKCVPKPRLRVRGGQARQKGDMNREDLRGEILSLDVYDTHTHLIGSTLAARDFWEIAHYFWFEDELRAAGYPRDAENLPEDERIDAFLSVFDATRNTSMNWVVRRIFHDLYDVQISDAASVRQADEAVQSTARRRNWAAQVARRIPVSKIVVNVEEDSRFRDLPNTCVLVPRIEGLISEWSSAIVAASDQHTAGDEVAGAIRDSLAGFKKQGCPGIMTTLGRFAGCTYGAPDRLKFSGNTPDQVLIFILHQIAAAAEAEGLFVQLFLGVEGGWNEIGFASANDPDRILKLYGLFESHGCDFELVLGSAINTLDAVQAARAYPNVFIGGQWWFNFRASTYRDSMQKCLEALPPSKRSLVVSDGRCIEWCYGKVVLIKYLLADFLFDQIELGWLDHDEAIRVAKEWLYTSAAARYDRAG